MAAGLTAEGFKVLESQGTYFLNLDLTASGIAEDDRSFSLRAIREHGVASIPVSSFYETAPVTNVLRLCFAKADATLDAGVERLARARDQAVRNRAGDNAHRARQDQALVVDVDVPRGGERENQE